MIEKASRWQPGSAASGNREWKGEGGRACKHCFKNLIPPTWKNKPFLVSKCQNLCMSSIELHVLAGVSWGHADLHSLLCSSGIAYVCCVSENLFECGSLFVGVQIINYLQMIRPIWRIETMVLQEQSQIKTMAKTICKTVNRLACKQPHLNHVVPDRTKELYM